MKAMAHMTSSRRGRWSRRLTYARHQSESRCLAMGPVWRTALKVPYPVAPAERIQRYRIAAPVFWNGQCVTRDLASATRLGRCIVHGTRDVVLLRRRD